MLSPTLTVKFQLKDKYAGPSWDPWMGPRNVLGKLEWSQVENNEQNSAEEHDSPKKYHRVL
jgi:hypothetical protein